jgi:hypothetical protein
MSVIRGWIAEVDADMTVLDGPEFDSAILGIVTVAGQPDRVLYSAEKVLDALVSQGMSREDAEEWYDFNIACAYMGEKTPAFLEEPEK